MKRGKYHYPLKYVLCMHGTCLYVACCTLFYGYIYTTHKKTLGKCTCVNKYIIDPLLVKTLT